MITQYREYFNRAFTEEKYEELKNDIAADFGYMPTFRIAETPFFISENLKAQLTEGCQDVIQLIRSDRFKSMTDQALELNSNVPNEDSHTTFLAIDFGICEENGEVIPKLIEVQGFPSLFNYQPELYRKFLKHYPFLEDLTPFFNGLDEESYLNILKDVILGGHHPRHVVLLEIEPEKQNTRIDFLYCKKHFGIEIICVTAVKKVGRQLFYTDQLGNNIQVKRIYNRVIFDELQLRGDLKLNFDFTDDLDVEWAGHPNWFFRISKYILPMLKGKYFIETKLLSELTEIPADLENYVLKPLFSFSGSGVIYHVRMEDIEAVRDKELFVLQKKVNYIPIVQAPDGKVKAEVRVLCAWKQYEDAPTLLCNLTRLSRGEMIGVKFNQDKDWVGGTIALFEKSTETRQ